MTEDQKLTISEYLKLIADRQAEIFNKFWYGEITFYIEKGRIIRFETKKSTMADYALAISKEQNKEK